MNIVAYGSLLNQVSLEKTLQRPAQLNRVVVPGWQRVYNAPFGDYAFLNVVVSQNSLIEAAYFSLDQGEVVKFAQREKGSELVEVCAGLYAFVWPTADCRELPVLQSYIDVCQAGAWQIGIDIWRGTKKPTLIINDQAAPLYP